MRRINALGFVAGSLAVAALGAAMWTSAGRVPEANSAGAEIMQILRDEHALVADYVKMDTEAKRLANATADQEAATLRLAAIERSRLRLAQAEAESKIQAAPEAKPERQQAVARASARGAPVAVAATAPVGQPLPPVQTANATIAPPAPAEGPVRSRLRQLVSDVQRLPEWVISAADWVTEAVPVPRLPRLPGHEFRAEL